MLPRSWGRLQGISNVYKNRGGLIGAGGREGLHGARDLLKGTVGVMKGQGAFLKEGDVSMVLWMSPR